MSYRELRNFCEMMRALGFPRTVSMENFRVANFKLAAEIIYWLVQRFDPKADFPDNIEDEGARIKFVTKGCSFFYQNLKVKLNAKKIYAADGHCVQELLKVASILYQAKRAVSLQNDFEFGQELDISSRKNDIERVKILSKEIVDLGINLLDLLDKEKGLKASRDTAIEYLESISKNYDNQKDEEIEKKIMGILSNQEKQLEQLDSHVGELKQRENELNQEVQVKKMELERAEKRLESLQHAQPAHLHEINQFENELSIIYRLYVEKIRNHDYLQSRVEKYQKIEEINKKNLKGIIEQNKQNDHALYHDQNDEMDNENMNYEEEDDTDVKNRPPEEMQGGEEGEFGNDDEMEQEDDDEHF